MSLLRKIGLGLICIGAIPILIGFGPTGIIGSSIAATIQSFIGNVSAGSIFATMTSMGMTGFFKSIIGLGGIVTIGQLLKNQEEEKRKREREMQRRKNICCILLLFVLFIFFIIFYKKFCFTQVDKEIIQEDK